MKKILIGGAGSALSEGVINSLLRSTRHEKVLGMGSEPTDLVLSSAQEKYYVPYANSIKYKKALLKLLETIKPDLIHFQNDSEIYFASKFRDEINAVGVKTFMPPHQVIDTCVHKFKTYLKCKEAGITVPVNMMVDNEEDLKKAFLDLGDKDGKIWIRATTIGGGGIGSLPTNDFKFAKSWIQYHKGWGSFIAAEMLTSNTVTWLSIWHEGELVVAQTKVRQGWANSTRTVSGVTGITKIGQTFSDPEVDRISIETIKAVTSSPHGIFGVDMTYDKNGIPNPTEINISRFFTTVLFFTEAGLNMPEIFMNIALYNEFPDLIRKINPLPNGLLWLRGMDSKPRLMTSQQIEDEVCF